MENSKTVSRLSRLKRLERLARQRVQQNRLWLHERQEELDTAIREHAALQSYRDSYRAAGLPIAAPRGPATSADLSPGVLAHRHRFVSRLCSEIEQLGEREQALRLVRDQQRDHLNEALRTAIGLSQLCDQQTSTLAGTAARLEQRQLDEVGQIRHGRPAHAITGEED